MSVDIRNEKYILALAADLEGYTHTKAATMYRFMSTDLTEAAEALRLFVKRSQWISVEERLPERGVVVWTVSRGAMATAYLGPDCGWFFATYGYGRLSPLPTHWMPLPEAPKEP
jgi:hypothetical protein